MFDLQVPKAIRLSVLISTWLLLPLSIYTKSYNVVIFLVIALFFLHSWNATGRLSSLRLDFELMPENWLSLFWKFGGILILCQNLTVFLVFPYLVRRYPTYYEYVDRLIQGPGDTWPFTLLIFIVLAPWLEEIFFRRFLLRKLRFLSIPGAVLVSSIIFGSLHANVVGAFGIGLILAILARQSGCLVLGIGLHMANNLVASLGVFSEKQTLEQILVEHSLLDALIFAGYMAAAMAGVWWLLKTIHATLSSPASSPVPGDPILITELV